MIRQANRLLLSLAARTQSNPASGFDLVTLYQPAKLSHLGIALEAATLLEARGFITLRRSTVLEDNHLQITSSGVLEAARLRLPLWRRWLEDKTLVRQLIAGVIGGFIVAVANGVLRLLWP